MTYYLIDYENTGENGLDGIIELSNDDKVIIFYSDNADKMSFDLHQKLQQCHAAVEFRKIATGKKNALDFQLATYLGYLIAREPGGHFCIVSKDLGYEVLLDFWKEKSVRLVDVISAESEKEIKRQSELEEKVKQLDLEEEEQQAVLRYITKYKTKQGVNNALVKQYGSEKAGELYKKIKALIKDKKGK